MAGDARTLRIPGWDDLVLADDKPGQVTLALENVLARDFTASQACEKLARATVEDFTSGRLAADMATLRPPRALIEALTAAHAGDPEPMNALCIQLGVTPHAR